MKRSFLLLTMLLLLPAWAGDRSKLPPGAEKHFRDFKPVNRIDELVLSRLRKLGIPPSERCSDAMFLRRAYLDVAGTLPSPDAARKFLADRSPKKRSKLIDQLLLSPRFAAYRALYWADRLRIKAEFPSNLWPNGVQAYDHWLRERMKEAQPYDAFVRELLCSSGSNFRDPPANFYRAFQERTPRRIAENVALLFMGLRIEKCGWPAKKIEGFSAFFSTVSFKKTNEWKEEIVFHDPEAARKKNPDKKQVSPFFPDGGHPKLAPGEDPRKAFAEWLTSPRNPWFARCIANRVWHRLTGRGIVEEADDMRRDNRPWNEPLLQYLADELVRKRFDPRHLYRLILNSRTWQSSSHPNKWNGKDDTGFSRYRVRTLDAEVLIDAIVQITGPGETYTSNIPEPFTYLPHNQKAVELADGSITSPFLELFGRPPRNTSFLSERSGRMTATQAQHLLNSSHIHHKLMRGWKLKQLAKRAQGGKRKNPRMGMDLLYLAVLSRFPTDDERKVAAAYVQSLGNKGRRDGVLDLVWALINSSEFLLKH